MKRILLPARGFSLLLLAVSLIGCAKEVPDRELEPPLKPQAIQLNDDQAAEASAFCQYLGDHKAKIPGATVSRDVEFATINGIVAEQGGNRYFIRDSGWIKEKPGVTTLYILFDVYLCEETGP